MSAPAAAAASKAARRSRKAIMTLTDAARERVKQLLSAKTPEPFGIKVGVKQGGCNGLTYSMDYATEKGKLDEVVEVDGLRVVIEPKAVMYLLGTEMDFVEDRVRAEFIFKNPNAASECGCGESFSVVR